MKRFIEKSYGIEMTGISPLPRGFYGEVYRVDTADRSYAAKLDHRRTHSVEFRESLEAVELICKSGIDFVPALIRGANGERCFSYDGGVLALFEFAEGEKREDVPADMLFERLGRVYARCAAGNMPGKELFSMRMYERRCGSKPFWRLQEASAAIWRRCLTGSVKRLKLAGRSWRFLRKGVFRKAFPW